MNQQFEYLFARRLPINYDAAAACEVNFSSTAEPMIVLDPFPAHAGVTGLRFEWDGAWKLKWDITPGAICYSVYRVVDEDDPYGDYVLVAECIPDLEITFDPGPGGGTPTFRVTVITEDGGETPIEDTPPVTWIGNCPQITGHSPATEPAFHEFQGWDDVSLSVTVAGTSPFTYNWYHEYIFHHSSSSSSYDFPMRKNLAGHWSVAVTGHVPGCSSANSNLWDIRYLPLQIITSGSLDPAACLSEPYAYACQAMHGTPMPPPSPDPYLWGITAGGLPGGLVIDPYTGVISGTPVSTGSSNFQLTVQDAEGDASSANCTIIVAGFNTPPGPTLAYGRTGDAYGPVTVLFGPAATCSLAGGALPPGLTISPAGVITGTPTTGGTYSFTLRVASTGMPAYSCTETYSIRIWTADNTLMTSWHLTTEFGSYVNLGTLGPGLYKIEGYNGGDPECFGWIWPPPPFYYVGVAGQVAGGPSPIISVDGSNILLVGGGGQDPVAATAIANAKATVVGVILATFECPGAGVMTSSWAARPAQYFTHPEAYSCGGSGVYYNLIRIGT
jgi:hypothetical protein